MKIYLVRHGETDWNNEKRLQGWADISLNAKGVKEAEEVAEKLKNVHFDDAFCSDLERAEVTAETILKGRDIEVQMDPRLRELGFGPLEGTLYNDARMDESQPLHELFVHPDKYVPEFGGEPLNYLSARAEAFQLSTLDMIQAKNPDATILVVSHGIFIRDMLTRVGGFSYDDFWKLPVGNCSIAVLSYDGKQLKIEEMGEKVTEWLV